MTPEERLAALRAAEVAGELSQWWPQPFTVDGVASPTAEHWMMAGKARLFDDADGLAAVHAAASPGAAKAAGRKVRGFDEARWREARYDPFDRIWGIGLSPTQVDVGRPTCWRGLNLLGFALMDVRERL